MSQNICPKCGGKIEARDGFCPACGNEISQNETLKKRNNLSDVAIILGALTVLFVGYLLLSKSPELPKPPQDANAEKDFKHPAISGMPAGTEAEYDRIIAGLPASHDSLVQLGNHFMDNQVFPLAIECYQRAIKLDPAIPAVITDLGASYHAMGQVEKAIAMFEKAIALKPDHPIALFNLGISYRGQNNLEKANYYWKKYLEVAPDSPLADTVKKYLAEQSAK